MEDPLTTFSTAGSQVISRAMTLGGRPSPVRVDVQARQPQNEEADLCHHFHEVRGPGRFARGIHPGLVQTLRQAFSQRSFSSGVVAKVRPLLAISVSFRLA